ncbi:serine/threonine-protein kinase ULK3-like isoform X2 [Dreissena polymorpha]|uniref:serine/threonine-protein kinase ULK3-like isoform X2 n=1 Tax=Dreissena polymorpha TaxID=45954 RepID=UPI002264CDE2|nr:serine/threonine-protein kinase ULK3-like isoform X2 [Dreissena polymorpha]
MSSARPVSAPVSRGGSLIPAPRLKDYIFVEKLGSGSYATVYKAFRKWDDTYIYLIMEFCAGGDLSLFLRKKRTLPEYTVRKFLRHIVSAMKFLHDNNVAHMDLKPQNILCTSSQEPVLKIADFGFAKHLYSGDQLHALRGSPLYMAPEIICRGKYDARVDLWSIGVILYECLFGRAPYASKSFRELEDKIWDTTPIELPYGVDMSDHCRDLLLGLLVRDPEKRLPFREFFEHPFLDLEHSPSPGCLEKATSLVKQAVILDGKGEYPAAVKHYCEAVEYFLPAIKFERDSSKKEVLRKRVQEYMDRAAEIKALLKPVRELGSSVRRSDSKNREEEMFDLFAGCDEMQAAIKLTNAAVIEEAKEEYEVALKHYELALGTSIQFLKSEEKGKRKDLLRENVDRWMTRAEGIKSYLSVKKCDDNMEQQTSLEEKEGVMMNQEWCHIQ